MFRCDDWLSYRGLFASASSSAVRLYLTTPPPNPQPHTLCSSATGQYLTTSPHHPQPHTRRSEEPLIQDCSHYYPYQISDIWAEFLKQWVAGQ
ncbi:unnamed protein product [Gadus morhua 'NCC']